jgi:hypothetical protein
MDPIEAAGLGEDKTARSANIKNPKYESNTVNAPSLEAANQTLLALAKVKLNMNDQQATQFLQTATPDQVAEILKKPGYPKEDIISLNAEALCDSSKGSCGPLSAYQAFQQSKRTGGPVGMFYLPHGIPKNNELDLTPTSDGAHAISMGYTPGGKVWIQSNERAVVYDSWKKAEEEIKKMGGEYMTKPPSNTEIETFLTNPTKYNLSKTIDNFKERASGLFDTLGGK